MSDALKALDKLQEIQVILFDGLKNRNETLGSESCFHDDMCQRAQQVILITRELKALQKPQKAVDVEKIIFHLQAAKSDYLNRESPIDEIDLVINALKEKYNIVEKENTKHEPDDKDKAIAELRGALELIKQVEKANWTFDGGDKEYSKANKGAARKRDKALENTKQYGGGE